MITMYGGKQDFSDGQEGEVFKNKRIIWERIKDGEVEGKVSKDGENRVKRISNNEICAKFPMLW